MEYYISPSWIYWINVIGSLQVLFISLMVFSGMGAIIAIPIIVAEDLIEENTGTKLEVIACVVFIISLFGLIFTPSKEVLIEMEVAKLATKQNVDLTVESLKSIVNYIIDAVAKLK